MLPSAFLTGANKIKTFNNIDLLPRMFLHIFFETCLKQEKSQNSLTEIQIVKDLQGFQIGR